MIDPRALAFLGWPEILFIAGIVVLLFGASRLPQIGRGLGEGIREFKKSLSDAGDDEGDPRRIDGGEGGNNGS